MIFLYVIMQNSDQQCLVYIAGDVSKYSPVKYKFENKEERTFFSAHALSKIFEVITNSSAASR
jgi:hypothetical protein